MEVGRNGNGGQSSQADSTVVGGLLLSKLLGDLDVLGGRILGGTAESNGGGDRGRNGGGKSRDEGEVEVHIDKSEPGTGERTSDLDRSCETERDVELRRGTLMARDLGYIYSIIHLS